MKKYGIILGLIIVLGIVFRNWFTPGHIIGGDWPLYYPEYLKEFSLFPPAWGSYHGNGLGGPFILYALDSFLYAPVYIFVNLLSFPWELVYKVLWFGLFLCFSIVSSFYFAAFILGPVVLWQLVLAAFVFIFNSYSLMVVGGGQMGWALAYALMPLVTAMTLRVIESAFDSRISFRHNVYLLKSSIIFGSILALQGIFDVRITSFSIGIGMLYALYNFVCQKEKRQTSMIFRVVVFVFLLPCIIGMLLHSFWLLPMIVSKTTPYQLVPSDNNSAGMFHFLSFTSFSQTISLLHPNWPENIFGKVYFMKPEFLMIPIIAFASLFFVKISKSKIDHRIMFFALLAPLGAFLAKGAQPPLEQVNIWLFTNFPGFVVFRDSTKFYILIVISYMVLIPYSVRKISEAVTNKIKKKIFASIFIAGVFGIWLFTVRPVFLGQLGGTLQKRQDIFFEYLTYEDYISKQKNFFRVLWIPQQQRFTFYSNKHPAISASQLFEATNSAEVIQQVSKPEIQQYLSQIAVKYIVVPYDVYGEIFSKDRKYDEQQYLQVIARLDEISWLRRVGQFNKLGVYETIEHKGHFWTDENKKITETALSPSHYILSLSSDMPSNLFFSESYSPYWQLRVGNEMIKPERTKDNLNRYFISRTGVYTAELFYTQEKYYLWGRIVSAIVFLMLLLLFVALREQNKKYLHKTHE